MQTLFISYSRHDSNITLDLADKLTNVGYKVWTDVKGIPGGAVWLYEIEEAITDCDAFIVIISKGAKESPWVRREMLFALDLKKPIIPIRIEEVTLPFALYDLQPIDHFKDADRIIHILNIILSDETPSATVPTPIESNVENIEMPHLEGLTLVEFHRYLLNHPDEDTNNMDEHRYG